jgi:hypothetical protein
MHPAVQKGVRQSRPVVLLQRADDRSKVAYQFIEPTGVEIYGSPGAFAMGMIEKVAGSGIAVSVKPLFLGGFIRPESG